MGLRSERKAAGLTQMQLARASKVSQATISGLESGREIDPKVSTLNALAAALRRHGRKRVTSSSLLPRARPRLAKGARIVSSASSGKAYATT